MAKTIKPTDTTKTEGQEQPQTEQTAEQQGRVLDSEEQYDLLQQKTASDLYREMLRNGRKRNQKECYDNSRQLASDFIEAVQGYTGANLDVLACSDFFVVSVAQSKAPLADAKNLIAESIKLHTYILSA